MISDMNCSQMAGNVQAHSRKNCPLKQETALHIQPLHPALLLDGLEPIQAAIYHYLANTAINRPLSVSNGRLMSVFGMARQATTAALEKLEDLGYIAVTGKYVCRRITVIKPPINSDECKRGYTLYSHPDLPTKYTNRRGAFLSYLYSNTKKGTVEYWLSAADRVAMGIPARSSFNDCLAWARKHELIDWGLITDRNYRANKNQQATVLTPKGIKAALCDPEVMAELGYTIGEKQVSEIHPSASEYHPSASEYHPSVSENHPYIVSSIPSYLNKKIDSRLTAGKSAEPQTDSPIRKPQKRTEPEQSATPPEQAGFNEALYDQYSAPATESNEPDFKSGLLVNEIDHAPEPQPQPTELDAESGTMTKDLKQIIAGMTPAEIWSMAHKKYSRMSIDEQKTGFTPDQKLKAEPVDTTAAKLELLRKMGIDKNGRKLN
ncbi:TPA: MarR family transcriptional regulator [Photobacterium damselae]